MDDFLHNLRNNKNKTFDRNRKHYDNPNFKGAERKNGKDRKNEDFQRILTPERITYITRFMDDLLNTQKQLIETAEKRLAVEERIALALEKMIQTGQAPIQTSSGTKTGGTASVNRTPVAVTDERRPAIHNRREVSELICQLRGNGLSYRQIADRLQELGIPTFSGRDEWPVQTIAKICKDMATTENPV